MKRTTIFIGKDLEDGLKALSAKTGAPMAELVRRAIAEYLKKQK